MRSKVAHDAGFHLLFTSRLEIPSRFWQKMGVEEASHFKDMLEELAIRRDWVDQALSFPDRTERPDDGTMHYFKGIHENGSRWLKDVVNVVDEPPRLVTVYFDRSARSRYENKSG